MKFEFPTKQLQQVSKETKLYKISDIKTLADLAIVICMTIQKHYLGCRGKTLPSRLPVALIYI